MILICYFQEHSRTCLRTFSNQVTKRITNNCSWKRVHTNPISKNSFWLLSCLTKVPASRTWANPSARIKTMRTWASDKQYLISVANSTDRAYQLGVVELGISSVCDACKDLPRLLRCMRLTVIDRLKRNISGVCTHYFVLLCNEISSELVEDGSLVGHFKHFLQHVRCLIHYCGNRSML